MEKVLHDLETAKIVWHHLPAYHDMISFHCQQAVEKSIKGILVYHGMNFKYSHNLHYLMELLSEIMPVDDEEYKKALVLNTFSVEVRYPNDVQPLTDEEVAHAIAVADYFMEKAIGIIRGKEG